MSDNLPRTMSSSLLSTESAPGMPTIGANHSGQGAVTNDNTRKFSTLQASLRGIDLDGSNCYLFINGYPAINELTLKQESIDQDLTGLRNWTLLFYPKPDFWQFGDNRGDSKRADDRKIRKFLRAPRTKPTLFYISGHTQTTTEAPGDQLAYVPADHLPADPKLIPYETMRVLLLENPKSAPLLFLTEVCFCENFLRLPYVLELEGNEVRWKETGYSNTFNEGSGTVVHFAATSPKERANSFDSGAVFTKAFYNIDPREEMSLKDIAKQIQENVNTILVDPASDDKTYFQHPKIYCSHIMDDPHFFKALGFYSPPDSDSSVGGDSDSNA